MKLPDSSKYDLALQLMNVGRRTGRTVGITETPVPEALAHGPPSGLFKVFQTFSKQKMNIHVKILSLHVSRFTFHVYASPFTGSFAPLHVSRFTFYVSSIAPASPQFFTRFTFPA
jgi:hypothetical protein